MRWRVRRCMLSRRAVSETLWGAEFVDALDVLPAHAVGAHRIVGRRRGGLAHGGGEQGADHVVGVRGLGEVVDGAGLHRSHGGRDVAVASEHHHADVRPGLAQGLDDRKARAVLEAHVEDGEGGGGLGDRGLGRLDTIGLADLEPARLQSPAEADPKRGVVVQQKKVAIGQRRDGVHVTHSAPPLGRAPLENHSRRSPRQFK